MATANRYSRFTPAQYTPYTLQELMLAPSYMRQQHDAMSGVAGELQGKIAQINPLTAHAEVAANEQQRLNDLITEQVDLLQNEGFNPATKNKFINLNKQYQESVAPTGVLGKINQAKADYQKEMEASIAGMIEQGWDPRLAEAKWMQHSASYNDRFGQTGNIESINRLYGPNKIDYIKEFTDLAKAAGTTATDIMTGGGGLDQDETGQWVVNTQNRQGGSDNIEQLQALADYMNIRMAPGGDIRETLDFMGKTPEQAMREIASVGNAFRKKSIIDHNTSSMSGFKAWDNKRTALDGMGVTATHQQFNVKDTGEFFDLAETKKQLETKPNRTQDEEAMLAVYNEYYDKVKNQIASLGTGEGGQLLEDLDYAQRQLQSVERLTLSQDSRLDELYQKEYERLSKINEAGYVPDKKDDAVLEAMALANAKESYQQELNKDIKDIKKSLDPFVEAANKSVATMTTHYTLSPRTTKQRTQAEIIGTNLANILSTNPQALEQNAMILSATTPEGTAIDYTGEEHRDDREELSSLVYQSLQGQGDKTLNNNKKVGLVGFTPHDASHNGLPTYSIRVKTSDEHDPDGFEGGVGGEDGSTIIKIAFKQNALGQAKNMHGLVGEYLGLSGPEGLEIAREMDYSLTEFHVKDQYRGMTWENAGADYASQVSSERGVAPSGLKYEDGTPTPVGEVYRIHLDRETRKKYGNKLWEELTPEEKIKVDREARTKVIY